MFRLTMGLENQLGRNVGRIFFKGLERRAPRAGTVVLESTEKLFQDVKSSLISMEVKVVEVCRGTDRYGVLKSQISVPTIPLRHTIILHRHTGKVIWNLGIPENGWGLLGLE